jgi:hypothetical protein
LLGRLLSRLLLRHTIQCRHHGTFPAEHRSTCQAENTVKSTVPDRVFSSLWQILMGSDQRAVDGF